MNKEHKYNHDHDECFLDILLERIGYELDDLRKKMDSSNMPEFSYGKEMDLLVSIIFEFEQHNILTESRALRIKSKLVKIKAKFDTFV